jgi:hypothetical protein
MEVRHVANMVMHVFELVCAQNGAEHGKANPHDEYRGYLESPLEDGVTEVIGYWGPIALAQGFNLDSGMVLLDNLYLCPLV